MFQRNLNRRSVLGALLAVGLHSGVANAQTLGSDFSAAYAITDLGSITDLPPLYGGLTFENANTLIIGGTANEEAGLLYQVSVLRDPVSQSITGFGAASVFRSGTIGAYNDGGVAFGLGGVLFTSRWPVNELGQTKPGSQAEDKIIDLGALGVAPSHAALNFVPAGFGGAGLLKLVSWEGGEWYSASLVPDGNGTFDLAGLSQVDLGTVDGNLPGGPEGFVYVSGANPGFGGLPSLLVAEYSVGNVAVYQVDASGDPIGASRRDFITGLEGAEGAVLDPVTGDFLFSTFGGGDRVIRVSGFTELPPVPEPSAYATMLVGLALLMAWARRRAPRAPRA
jgi:hypothetical protein